MLQLLTRLPSKEQRRFRRWVSRSSGGIRLPGRRRVERVGVSPEGGSQVLLSAEEAPSVTADFKECGVKPSLADSGFSSRLSRASLVSGRVSSPSDELWLTVGNAGPNSSFLLRLRRLRTGGAGVCFSVEVSWSEVEVGGGGGASTRGEGGFFGGRPLFRLGGDSAAGGPRAALGDVHSRECEEGCSSTSVKVSAVEGALGEAAGGSHSSADDLDRGLGGMTDSSCTLGVSFAAEAGSGHKGFWFRALEDVLEMEGDLGVVINDSRIPGVVSFTEAG